MSARLSVLRPGAGVTVQDFGRKNFRAFGVALSGALDQKFLAAANFLGAAPEGAAGLEILLAAPELRVTEGAARIGLAGDLVGMIERAEGGREEIFSWRGVVLRAGDVLSLKLGRGPAYLGFSGGLDLPKVLGSRSTFLRAGFGGLEGRALRAGDALCCGAAEGGDVSAPPFSHQAGLIRFIPGPQDDHFTPEAQELLVSAPWRVGADSDTWACASPARASPTLRRAPISSPTERLPARSRSPATASRSSCAPMDRLLGATPRSAASSRPTCQDSPISRPAMF